MLQHIGAFVVGLVIGFLGGLFGKGGSAIATPMLHLIGFPAFVAIAAPLPATVPGTLVASAEYWKSGLIDWEIVRWSLIAGVPATIAGSYFTALTGATPLLVLTGLLVLGFGLSFLLAPRERRAAELTVDPPIDLRPSNWRTRMILVSVGVGIISGLLANSGGFLLAPSYARVLNQPIKKAFACSLAASVILALPGTLVHWHLGHIDWAVTGLIALGSVPLSYLGAKVALRSKSSTLERWYGLALTVLGAFFLTKI